MYHLSQPVITMDTPFTRPINSANSRNILKSWVKETSKFRMKPSQVYKKMILQKAYQHLVIFSFHLYGQESIEIFPQSWVIVLDQLVSEGGPLNWFDMLALRLKEQVIEVWHPPKGQQAKLFMSAYIFDAVYAFPDLGWPWTPSETFVHNYCKLFSKWSFPGVIIHLSNHFVTLVYRMIFEQDPP